MCKVDGDEEVKEQAGLPMEEAGQQLASDAGKLRFSHDVAGLADDLLGAAAAEYHQPQLPWDKPHGSQGLRKRRQPGGPQPGSLPRAHHEDVADWPFRWSGHRPRSGPIPRGMVF